MPHGPGPDYNRLERTNIIGEIDLAEHAVRLLGGRGSMHRGGQALFSTNFEYGIQEISNRVIVGAGSVLADTVLSEFGPRSCKVTHGAVVGNYTQIHRSVPGHYASKIGQLATFRLPIMYTSWRLYVRIGASLDTGGINYWILRLDYSSNALALAVYDGVGSPITKATRGLVNALEWASIKLVVDNTAPASPTYDSIIINGVEYDIGGQAAQHSGSTGYGLPTLDCYIKWEARFAQARAINIGSWEITVGEP